MNELVQHPSWWKRNWKWVVPLGGCFTLILIFIIFIGSFFYGVTSALEGSQPYEYALEKINSDEEMISALGSPIEKDGMVQGNYSYNNGSKSADMVVPISGPKVTVPYLLKQRVLMANGFIMLFVLKLKIMAILIC